MSYNVGIINNGYVPSQDNGRAYAPRLEQRMENQNARVSNGSADGSLNQGELDQVNGTEAQYESLLNSCMSDGSLSPQERTQLKGELNNISDLIHADRHNDPGQTSGYNAGKEDNGYIPTGGNGRAYAPGLEGRMENQNSRVDAGIADGSLDQGEQQQIGGMEQLYESTLNQDKSDGSLNKQDRQQLNQMLSQISQAIHTDRHN
jgi:hypothetical protein